MRKIKFFLKKVFRKIRDKGFTLIELLVVVAIISFLASIVTANMASARQKAVDVKKISEFRQVSTAMSLYFDKYGFYPNQGANVATNQWQDNFDSMVSQLVSEGFLSAAVSFPNSGGSYDGYNYYNYGPGNAMGAFLVTILDTAPKTIKGIPPSCRPYTGVVNWCTDDKLTTEYCICNPH